MRKLNIVLLFLSLIILIMGIWGYSQIRNQIGDIHYDPSKQSEVNFTPCSRRVFFQYYNVGTSYRGGRKAIRKSFPSDLINRYSGLPSEAFITVRFVVNCNSEIGWFTLKAVDTNMSTITINRSDHELLIAAISNMRGWKAGKYQDKVVDSYGQITFIVMKGKIIDIF